ncbi:MAG: iron-sulfur cluster assembly scaffold protein [Planctomycetota bacterium]|nr:iron-sulfur cluster assembly scaffold protein [Planctomycetota bacterium]
MDPRALLEDHRRHPRHLGKMLNPTLSGDVGSILAGDALRLYLRLEGERISEARFQVFNASEQVAAASVVCELLPGRTLAEAQRLTAADLCQHLGGLDPCELPAFIWALEALRVAIASWNGELPEGDEEFAPLLCRCHGIAEDTVRESIRIMGLSEVQAVVDATGAGTGCGSCRADIPRLLNAAAAPPPPRRGRIALLKQIARVVEQRLQGEFAAHGGRLELWDLDGERLRVRCHGLSEEQRRSLLTQLERVLRAEVAAGLTVEELAAAPSA